MGVNKQSRIHSLSRFGVSMQEKPWTVCSPKMLAKSWDEKMSKETVDVRFKV